MNVMYSHICQTYMQLSQASRQVQASGLLMGLLTFIDLAEHPAAQDLVQADAVALQNLKAPGII